MSMPDHTEHSGQSASAGEVEARQARDLQIYNHATNPTRTTRAISWAGWHLAELAGVTVPLALGLTEWDGFYAVSGLAALAWAANEVRLHRREKACRDPRATTKPNHGPNGGDWA